MHQRYLIFLLFLVSILLIDGDSTPTASKDTSESALQSDFATGGKFHATDEISLLRSSATDKGHQEERAGVLSFFEKVKSVFTFLKRTPEKQKWLKEEKFVDTEFKRLHLNNPEYFLFDNPHFAAWVGYCNTLSANFPEMSAISTLTSRYSDAILYEMIQRAKISPDTKGLARELEAKQMEHWLATRKDPDELFRIFRLGWDWSTMLKKPEFTIWAKYVDDLNTKHPEEPVWMYSSLTKLFNDDVLFEKTEAVKRLDQTKAITMKVEDDWLQAGIQNHKTPFQVLQNLGLGKTTDNLLEKTVYEASLVRTWVKYMEEFNRRYPKEKTTMMETFTKTFGDIGVTKMIEAAKRKSWTRDLATKMEIEQLKMWLDSGKSVDEVFNLLRLNEVLLVETFQEKVLFDMWVSYINAFIKANPDRKDAVFSALQSRFMDEPFNKILIEAKKYPSMESTAIKIQTDKIATYLANNKSPRDVFKRLSLKDEGDDLLGSPLFNAWMKYVETFNKRNPNHQQSWFYVLHHEHEHGGVRTIEKAMQNPSTVEIGKLFQREWLDFWLDRKISPKKVFLSLQLKNAREKVLSDQKFKTWTTYLDDFNRRYPDDKTTVIDGLRANYNDISMLRIFDEAKKDPRAKDLVIDLENALINKWLVEKKSLEYLHNQLGHGKSSDDIIKRYATELTANTGHTS